MEKTIAVHLKEQREKLLEEIAEKFEQQSKEEILSNYNTYNDCAVIAKMYLKAAHEVRSFK
jgi:hypothetical protein